VSRKRPRPSAKSSRPVAAAVVVSSVAHTPADARRWIYGGLDLLLALAYAAVVLGAARSRFTEGRVLLDALPAFAACAATGMFIGGRFGWRAACIGCGGLLVVAAWLLLALCIDAAFLTGVYGAFGKAAASFSLITGLLVIELVALVPALQLKWLRTRRGRRAFGVAPGAVIEARPA
jgi:hypothetical protein